MNNTADSSSELSLDKVALNVTCRMLEDILADEKEHADEHKNWLDL